VLRAIAEGKGPSHWIVALGYAGWTDGQLDAEMTRHGWFSTHADTALLYDVGTFDRWERAFEGAGIDPRLLASETGTA
jgi:putative transcriptional regulator